MLATKNKGEESESWMWDGLALASRGETTFATESHFSGGVPVVSKSSKGTKGTKGTANRDQAFFMNDYLGTTLGTFKGNENTSVTPASFGSQATKGEAVFTGKPYDADLGAHVFAYRNYRADLRR